MTFESIDAQGAFDRSIFSTPASAQQSRDGHRDAIFAFNVVDAETRVGVLEKLLLERP
jgi:hypothetical protein